MHVKWGSALRQMGLTTDDFGCGRTKYFRSRGQVSSAVKCPTGLQQEGICACVDLTLRLHPLVRRVCVDLIYHPISIPPHGFPGPYAHNC